MPHLLIMLQTRTPTGDRARMLARFRRAQEAARAADVKYWVFSDGAQPSACVEFFEGPDAERLHATLRQLEYAPSDYTILSEVELD